MVELTSTLPDPESMAQFCVIVLAIIVAWDAWWLGRQRIDIPSLGDLPNFGFAWESNQSQEVSRQWANLLTMGAMMVLPWMLAELSDTPILWVWIWDILLALHLISLLFSVCLILYALYMKFTNISVPGTASIIITTDKNSVFLLNNEIINLAGVVGGKRTSCTSKTKTVLVECAFFKPEKIIGKSVKYDIQSEASHKFERSVDPTCHESVLRRFINLVSEYSSIKKMSFVSYKFRQNKVTKIPIMTDKINQIIGINISQDSYLSYLSRLGFIINDGHIEVPSYRSDIETQNDLAEEIARVIGYDNIARKEIFIPKGKKSNKHDLENNLKFFLLDEGFYEIINSPFVGSDSSNSISVDNPLDSNKKYLRSNLTESLLENLLYNERRQKDSIKLFEISDIYTIKNNKINVTRKLGIIASGRAGHNYKDFSKKISKKYLTSVFKETLPNENFEFKVLNRDLLNTKVKNEIICCEVDIANFSSDVLSYKKISKPPENFIEYSPISDLPYSIRDLSFSIKDFTELDKFIKYILEFKHKLLKEKYIFDYFNNEKNAEIKIGFRFIFQSADSTITEAQVNDIISVIIDHTEEIDGITIPGLT